MKESLRLIKFAKMENLLKFQPNKFLKGKRLFYSRYLVFTRPVHPPIYLAIMIFIPISRNGVDEVVCLSVNDAFVMDAWSVEQGIGETHTRWKW